MILDLFNWIIHAPWEMWASIVGVLWFIGLFKEMG